MKQHMPKFDLEPVDSVMMTGASTPYMSVAEVASPYKSSTMFNTTRCSSTTKPSSCASSATKIPRAQPALHKNYYTATPTIDKRSSSQDVIFKMKEICDQKVKELYIAKHSSNFKVGVLSILYHIIG